MFVITPSFSRLWLLLFWGCMHSAAALTLAPADLQVDLVPAVQVLEDPNGQWDIDTVQSPAFTNRFKAVDASGSALNFGFASSAYWLRVRLQKQSAAPDHWLLEIPRTTIDLVDAYVPGHAPVLTGSLRPMSSRPFRERYFVFPVTLSDKEQTVYLRVHSSNALFVPLRLWQTHARLQSEGNAQLLQYLYYGALAALMLIHSLVSLSLRERRFMFYALYALPLGLGMLAGNGFGRVLLWPNARDFDQIAQPFFFGLAGAMALQFSREFLLARQHWPRIDRAMQINMGIFLLVSLLLLTSLWWPLPVIWINQTLFLAGVCMALLMLRINYLAYAQRLAGVRFFALSWVLLSLGIFVASLHAFGWLPTTPLTAYAVQISTVGEMLLLSLALAEAVASERLKRERTQSKALEMANSYAERLEQEVSLRTQELHDKAEQLARSLDNEQKVLAQYVRFGSMISHELRNPLAVIDNQIRLLEKEQQHGIEASPERFAAITGAIHRMSRLFDQWLRSDWLGQSLQELTAHPLPLRPWLERLVRDQFALGHHRIELRLTAPVDQVLADDHLLDIALNNLIENAVKYSEPGTLIELETRVREGHIGIAVRDQGPGIAPEHQSAIFQDFFRIQPEGRVHGIGLGLSIAQRIAQAHGGELTLESTPGQGCVFCIWLPADVHPQ